MSRLGNKHMDSFLNAKKTIQLPSNLLSQKRDRNRKQQSIGNRPARLMSTQVRLPKSFQTPAYIEEKNENQEKSVLYKRLSNIRGENKQLGGLSFSKMLSRMVVMGDEEDIVVMPFEQRMRQTEYVRPVEVKVYDLKCDNLTQRLTKSIDIDELKRPSRKLFKKYYMPSSETAQTIFLQNYNRNDKYIYKDGKRVECKRIHNFYTSHMFRKGYDQCFRRTSESFQDSR